MNREFKKIDRLMQTNGRGVNSYSLFRINHYDAGNRLIGESQSRFEALYSEIVAAGVGLAETAAQFSAGNIQLAPPLTYDINVRMKGERHTGASGNDRLKRLNLHPFTFWMEGLRSLGRNIKVEWGMNWNDETLENPPIYFNLNDPNWEKEYIQDFDVGVENRPSKNDVVKKRRSWTLNLRISAQASDGSWELLNETFENIAWNGGNISSSGRSKTSNDHHSYVLPGRIQLSNQPEETRRIDFTVVDANGNERTLQASKVHDANGQNWLVDYAAVQEMAGGNLVSYSYKAYGLNGKVINAATGALNYSSNAVTHVNAIPDTVYRTSLRSQVGEGYLADTAINREQGYDAFGKIAYQTDWFTTGTADGDKAITRFTYDQRGLLLTKTDAQVTAVSASGVAAEVQPQTTYYYDQFGNSIAERDANGNVTQQSWSAGKVVKTLYADGGVREVHLDALGDERTLINYGYTQNLTYNYDYATAETTVATTGAGINGTLTRTYDGAGNLIYTQKRMSPTSTTTLDVETHQAFDGLGRLISTYDVADNVQLDNSKTFTYSWVAAIGTAGGYRLTTTRSYTGGSKYSIDDTDYFGRNYLHRDEGGHTFEYTYNDGGNLLEQTSSTGQDISYRYYANGRLMQTNDRGVNSYTHFDYDIRGNKTREQIYSVNEFGGRLYRQDTTAHYDAANRLQFLEDERYTIRYTFDANGNIRSMTSEYKTLDENSRVIGAGNKQSY